MEDIINQIDGQVQIIFEKTDSTINQTFRDAIWMPQAEYDAASVETIDALKKERFDNWLAIVTDMFNTSTPE
jgi:acylphosphatase